MLIRLGFMSSSFVSFEKNHTVEIISDMIVLNKRDLVEDSEVKHVTKSISKFNVIAIRISFSN